MKSANLLQGLSFQDASPNADPLYVDRHGRAIRFALKAGQIIKAHQVPESPFYVVILKGHGVFAGSDGKEQRFDANELIVFDPAEIHSVRAEDEELVLVGFLHGAPSNLSHKIGGDIGRAMITEKKK